MLLGGLEIYRKKIKYHDTAVMDKMPEYQRRKPGPVEWQQDGFYFRATEPTLRNDC